MTPKIKELAIEARLFTGWPIGECEYQKFAELIISECVNQCFTDDGSKILKHFDIPEEDEELDEGCPCGYDGGTSCGSPNCYLLTGKVYE